MRFTLSNVPTAIGLLAPVWMSLLNFPMSWSSIAKYYASVLALRHVLLMKKLSSKKDLTPVLEVISVSHYVESVRWCMEHTGVKFREQRDVGILGAFAFGRMVPQLHIGASTLADSKLILRYLYGHTGDEFYKPTERALELEKKIDRLGLHIRRWGYYHLLREKNGFHNGLKLWGLYSAGIPLHQKALLLLLYPVLRIFLFAILGINKKNAEISYGILNEILDEFDKIVTDGKYLLGGEKPTFTDIQFCSLLCITHPLYTGGALTPSTAEVTKTASPVMQKQMTELLERPCGKFATAFYDKFRKPEAKL
eukprot:TRINITY_DN2076_c0_g1_i1.p1 TRINITY_DN2076_c0_g1~~TRINITY_DN2076_c0_g1_i1.p1  ORF type:complete len:309 (+),score=51.78 TRINITY_DN2076_c0_g1_i1:42-968(+)